MTSSIHMWTLQSLYNKTYKKLDNKGILLNQPHSPSSSLPTKTIQFQEQ